MVIGGIIIWFVGGDPFLAYKGLIQGSWGSKKAISETFIWATPYILAGLAVALAFNGGLFNIGAEGQLAVGATCTALVGYALPVWLGFDLPIYIHLPLALIAGMIGGGIWAAIPGALKAYTGAHEVINTIMMNYIALNTISYLMNGVMKDRSPTNVIARTPLIAESARIPPIFDGLRLHWGFILALVVAFLIWWLLNKTTLGFEIRTVGLNPDAAKYAGINVKRIIILTMTFSGMLAGLAGSIEVTGLNYRHELGLLDRLWLRCNRNCLARQIFPAWCCAGVASLRFHAQWRDPYAVPDTTACGFDLNDTGFDPALCCGGCDHTLYLPHQIQRRARGTYPRLGRLGELWTGNVLPSLA